MNQKHRSRMASLRSPLGSGGKPVRRGDTRSQGRPPGAGRASGGSADDGGPLWDDLRECHRRMRSELRAVVGRHGIYLSEYRALSRLREGPRTLSDLAEGLGLTPASMTDLAEQLLRRRWVVRLPHPTDGRSRILRITGSGERIYAAARREYRARLAEVYRELSSASKRWLTKGLEELTRVLVDRSTPRNFSVPERGRPVQALQATKITSTRAGREGAMRP